MHGYYQEVRSLHITKNIFTVRIDSYNCEFASCGHITKKLVTPQPLSFRYVVMQ